VAKLRRSRPNWATAGRVTASAEAGPVFRARLPVLRLVSLFALLALLPLALLSFFTIHLSGQAVAHEVNARMRTTSTVTAALVQQQMQSVAELTASYASRPSLIAALADGKPGHYHGDVIDLQLTELQAAGPGIGGAFVTDTTCRLTQIEPANPAVVGVDFSFRDWCKGARATGRAYVSEAYQTAILGHSLVVAAAVIVRATSGNDVGRPLGILAVVYTFDALRGFADQVARVQGIHLTITDRHGTVVVGSTKGPDPRALVSAAGDPRVHEALAGRSGVTRSITANGDALSAFTPVGTIGWTVTAEVPAREALAGVARLRSTVLSVAGLIGLILSAGIVMMARTLRLRRVAERDLEALVVERTAHAAQQAAIAHLGRVALPSSDLAFICDRAEATVAATLHADRADVVEYSNRDCTLSLVRPTSPDDAHIRPRLSVDEDSPWSSVLGAASPLMLDAVDCNQLFGPEVGQGQGLWATIAVHHEPFGGLVCQRDDPQLAFTSGDLSFLGAVTNIVGSAVNRIRNEEELNHQALHDPMTGLPNRVLLVDRLNLALDRLHRQHTTLAVLFVDVDQFKVINDSLGHDQGDRLLVLMSERLTGAVRPGDTVARFGGDEFVVLCEDLLGENEAVSIGERIRQAAATPLVLDNRDYFVTVSTGIALTDSPDMAAADLLRDADSAMYQAKQTGRARSAVFAQSMRTRAVRRLDTELALRQAITVGQLRLDYQPIVNLTTGRTDGVEALVRWEHPTEGLLFPSEFIAIAEETGLIVPLGEWVLGEACRQIQTWRTQYPQLSHLGVSVNLSGRQIAQSDVVSVVANVLADTGLPPGRLVLEITESVLMADAEYAITVLRGLKDLGVRLSVDDFGTGYSSLSYLKRFPVDILKIDRSFVDGLGVDDEDSAIVQATINLAHSLGLTTVAEGTETPGQVRALTELGCDKAQGYLFSRPQPATTLIGSLLQPSLHQL
jgi:diguanylate cyclase (GGDEF)-like protein